VNQTDKLTDGFVSSTPPRRTFALQILKAVRMAKDAAGAMATVADVETNETTTVDLDKNTHGRELTAEQRLQEQRMASTTAASVTPTASPSIPMPSASPRPGGSPRVSPKSARSAARPGSAGARPRSAGSVGASSPKPGGSPRSARTPSRLAEPTVSAEPLTNGNKAEEKGDEDDDDDDEEEDDDEDEEAERKMEERMQQLRDAAAARKAKGLSPDGGGARPKSAGSITTTVATTSTATPTSGRNGATGSDDSQNILRVTSESGDSAVVATEDRSGSVESPDTRILGADGFMRPARRPSFADVVDEATDEMRRRKVAKKKKAALSEKFLKDCDTLDEAVIKAQVPPPSPPLFF
jgi:hypothetical protein